MHFNENSRVWVYQADRELTEAEAQQIQQQLTDFTAAWTAHNNQLKAWAEIRYNRFIILMVDEMQAGASGCSIDKSVRFLKLLEQQYGITLFDRFNIAYREANHIISVNRNTFEQLIQQGKVDENTIVFNNLVQNMAELQTRWEVPFRDSWHMQLFGNLLANFVNLKQAN